MLSAYFDIKKTAPSAAAVVTPQPETRVNPKVAKAAKPKSRKAGKRPKAQAPDVEPFDLCEGGAVHARFDPPVASSDPAGVAETHAVERGPGDDDYEYLWQDADAGPGVPEEEDTDSCITFDDDVSDVPDTLSASPSDAAFDALDKAFFGKRKSKTSEMPVYSGPELWYEDDGFIE